MSAKKIIDLFAEVQDKSEPLLTFSLGETEITIWHPDDISQGDLTDLVKTQLLNQAIAGEYTELSDRYQKILDKTSDSTVVSEGGEVEKKPANLTREDANQAATLLSEMNKKQAELNMQTCRYIECLARLNEGQLLKKLQDAIATAYPNGNAPALDKLIGIIFKSINDAIAERNDKKQEVVTYAEATEEGKHQSNEQQNSLNNSNLSLPSSAADMELIAVAH
ncbi:MAG: hypothetical protein KatS3mg087_0617 [Patescibacteria group bacterium]|nr:MAG: hypothetical protein KatS3mg087_0617 [Patescibacteria group bacterium]